MVHWCRLQVPRLYPVLTWEADQQVTGCTVHLGLEACCLEGSRPSGAGTLALVVQGHGPEFGGTATMHQLRKGFVQIRLTLDPVVERFHFALG